MKKVIMFLLLTLASTSLYASDVDNDFIEVGADVVSYSGFSDATDLKTDVAVNARWGTLWDTGLYAWGSYEQPKVKFDGMKVAEVRTFGVGGGLRVPFDRTYAFAELGYYMPSSGDDVVPMGYDNGVGGSIGVGYDITSNFTVNAKYRFLKVDQKSPFNEEVVDMSGVSIGVSYRF